MLVNIAIVVFLIAAVFGLIILTAILRDQPTPKHFVLVHGPLAATGIVLLIIDIARGNGASLLLASVIIFVLAALGGFTLLALDTLGKPIPKPLAVIHPLVAVTALVVLLVYAFR